MVYAPPVDRSHLEWLMKEIEAVCAQPDKTNLARIKGQRDLELVIVVDKDDRPKITAAFIERMVGEMKKRTGIFMPVIYLDGNAPPDPDPYY